MSAAEKLFGDASQFLELIDEIVPIAAGHQYTFVSDEWYKEWLTSDQFSVERSNFIVALDLVEKAHLASLTALIRAKRWADAVCLMCEQQNFLGWAAAYRGLLESAGDTLDGLLHIPQPLARHHRRIAKCLAGEAREEALLFDELNKSSITLCMRGGCGESEGKRASLKQRTTRPTSPYWSRKYPTSESCIIGSVRFVTRQRHRSNTFTISSPKELSWFRRQRTHRQ